MVSVAFHKAAFNLGQTFSDLMLRMLDWRDFSATPKESRHYVPCKNIFLVTKTLGQGQIGHSSQNLLLFRAHILVDISEQAFSFHRAQQASWCWSHGGLSGIANPVLTIACVPCKTVGKRCHDLYSISIQAYSAWFELVRMPWPDISLFDWTFIQIDRTFFFAQFLQFSFFFLTESFFWSTTYLHCTCQ